MNLINDIIMVTSMCILVVGKLHDLLAENKFSLCVIPHGNVPQLK
jgi:hypothetical protein